MFFTFLISKKIEISIFIVQKKCSFLEMGNIGLRDNRLGHQFSLCTMENRYCLQRLGIRHSYVYVNINHPMKISTIYIKKINYYNHLPKKVIRSPIINVRTIINPLIGPRPVFNCIGDWPIKLKTGRDLMKGLNTAHKYY